MGPVGPQGPQGAMGPMGPMGPQGLQGERGFPGATGPIGLQGLQGQPGLDGAMGPQGPEGPQGPQGVQGEIGPQGDVGPQGPQGSQGPMGATGAQGPMGATGPQGPAGPAGAAGPAGPQGVPGPGSLMRSSVANSYTPIQNTCTNFLGGVVYITPPSSGYVVVDAQVMVSIDHTQGIMDHWGLTIGVSASDCSAPNDSWWQDMIPASLPSEQIMYRTARVQRTFWVNGGITSAFYVNGDMHWGQSAGDKMAHGNMVAVFYPA